MRGNNDRIHIEDHLGVISLKRTPQRLKSFRRNANSLKQWNVHVLEGVDGAQQRTIQTITTNQHQALLMDGVQEQ